MLQVLIFFWQWIYEYSGQELDTVILVLERWQVWSLILSSEAVITGSVCQAWNG